MMWGALEFFYRLGAMTGLLLEGGAVFLITYIIAALIVCASGFVGSMDEIFDDKHNHMGFLTAGAFVVWEVAYVVKQVFFLEVLTQSARWWEKVLVSCFGFIVALGLLFILGWIALTVAQRLLRREA
jgi:hypothetical protein